MNDKIAAALGGFRERVEDARAHVQGFRESVQLIRNAAPTLTTGLLVLVFGLGVFAGWWVSKPFTRLAVNAEWRERLAANSASVRGVIKQGNADAGAADDEIIKALGETDAKLSQAERDLKAASRALNVGDKCRVPAECVRRQ